VITATLRRVWKVTPDDAARVALVSALMPVAFMLYHIAWTQMQARIVFTVSVGILGLLVGYLIQERRDVLGYFIGSCSIGATIAALGSLVALSEPTWTWRTVMAASQANMVLGWFILWRVRQRWISRGIAFWSFGVSLVGLVFYLLANFGLPDPALSNPLTWGFSEPRGIIARTMRLPLEPVLAVLLWLAIALKLRKYLLRHGPG
jgi:hypothetical protein